MGRRGKFGHGGLRASPFTIIPELNIIEFPYPIRYANGGYEEPALYLTTSYYLLDEDGEGLVSYKPRWALSHQQVGTTDWVLPHPELWQTHVVRSKTTTCKWTTRKQTRLTWTVKRTNTCSALRTP